VSGVWKVTKTNTLWVFVSCSHEPRHLYDVIFAVDCLRHRGVADAHIRVFVDHPTPGPYLTPYGISAIHSVEEVASKLAATSRYQHVFTTVAGHGSTAGLGPTAHTVSPTKLLTDVRSVAGISHATLLVTQCYGGIFNLLDATQKPETVTIGATNLNPSLSAPINMPPIKQKNGSDGVSSWTANLFMLEFFNWLRAPKDVDGDGRATLVDAYKHAGAATNQHLRAAKAGLFMQVRRLGEELETARKQGKLPVEIDAIELKLNRSLETLHLHQEPWLLHANLARQIQV
jgi:hypothetical protein